MFFNVANKSQTICYTGGPYLDDSNEDNMENDEM